MDGFHAAAHAGDIAALRSLLPAHDINATTNKGDTALHLVSLGGHHEALGLLLSATPAPDPNAANAAGWTPLMLAVLSGAPSAHRHTCVRMLLTHGAGAAPVAQGGWTVALLAARRGDHECLAAVLEHDAQGAAAGVSLESRTVEGDTALHLAAHSGCALCVRLLLSAGVDAGAFNAQGLDAATLCVHAACRDDGGDAATARYAEILSRLAAAHSQPKPVTAATPASATAAPVPRSVGWGALHGALLRQLADAPRAVPLRRLLALCAQLRRCGCHDHSEPGRSLSERPSAIAAQVGRASLAALLRAPPPAPTCLLAVRRPIERPSPRYIYVHEGGAVSTPHLVAEPTRLRRATLSALRPPEEGHRSAEDLARSGPAAMAAIEQMAEHAALDKLGGGPVERWRCYELAGELPPEAMPYDNGAPHVTPAVTKVLSDAVQMRYGARREPLASALAACRQEHTAPPHALAAAAASDRRVPKYRQLRRWGDDTWGTVELKVSAADGVHAATATVEVLELAPQFGAPLLRDAHLDLLREVLGPGALEEADDSPSQQQVQPWGVYVERLCGSGAPGTPNDAASPLDVSDAPQTTTPPGGEGWYAVAEVFSLETPMLLSFAAEDDAESAMMRELAETLDEDDDDLAFATAVAADDEDDEEGDPFEAVAMSDAMMDGGAVAQAVNLNSGRPQNRSMRTSE